MVIGIDFNGVLCTHKWPLIGDDIGAFPWLHQAKKIMPIRWVLHTGIDGEALANAIAWCNERELNFWGININHKQSAWTTTPKLYAHLFIDDLGLGAPIIHYSDGRRPHIDWAKAGPMLLDRINEYKMGMWRKQLPREHPQNQ